MYDFILQNEVQDKPGMLFLLNFEKALDSVSWNNIINVLQFFTFGEYLIHLVKIIFTYIKRCVMQHGIFSAVRGTQPLHLSLICVLELWGK